MAVRETHAPIYASTFLDELLEAIRNRPASALLDSPLCHLFVNDISPNQETLLTDFVVATFNGYNDFPFTAPYGPGNFTLGRGLYTNCRYLAGSGIVSPGEVCYGYYVTNGSAPQVLMMSERFDQPVSFAEPGDFLDLMLIFGETYARQIN